MQDASMLWREMQIVITLRTGDHSLPRMDAHIWGGEKAGQGRRLASPWTVGGDVGRRDLRGRWCRRAVDADERAVRWSDQQAPKRGDSAHVKKERGRTGCTGALYWSFTTNWTAGDEIGYCESNLNLSANASP